MTVAVLRGDARRLPLPDASVDLICTSPPYFGLRSYTDGGVHYDGQIGSEATPGEWLAALLECTAEWVRVLKPEGSIFVNLGDKYTTGAVQRNGLGASTLRGHGGDGTSRDQALHRQVQSARDAPAKSLLGLPWRYAIGCVDQLGLILRAEIIWAKPNGLPESVTDRVRRSHEQVFHRVKQPRYYAAVDEIREPHAEVSVKRAMPHRSPPGRRDAEIYNGQPSQTLALAHMNHPLGKLPGSVWEIPSAPLVVPPRLGVDHFAAFPASLVRPVVLGWSPPGACTACGQGRRPVISSTYTVAQNRYGNRFTDGLAAAGTHGQGRPGSSAAPDLRRHVEVTGYVCACPTPAAPTHPAVILDPFGGTGTTALVASVYGRHGISVDLSADYTRLARWRTSDPGERARAMQVPKPPPVPDGQDALFA